MTKTAAAIAVPGVRVGCTYREGFGHAGQILAMDDPYAWHDTLAFYGPDVPDPAKVSAHVARCVEEIPGFCSQVPVRWSFGRIYWERIESLYPLDAGKIVDRAA